MTDASSADAPAPLDRRDAAEAKTFAGPQTWAAIRESYLNGVPATVLETRYGVKAGTIWKRAQRQGWTHASGPEAPPAALPPLFPEDRARAPARDPAVTARDAAEAADRAMRDGRLGEALKLARIAAVLGRVAGSFPNERGKF